MYLTLLSINYLEYIDHYLEQGKHTHYILSKHLETGKFEM